MTAHFRALALLCCVLLSSGPLAAQSSPETPKPAVDHLRVQIVLSRFQGAKKVSAVPYELPVRTDGGRGQLRMGTQVPVPYIAPPPGPEGKEAPPMAQRFNYKDVGTNIDCVARTMGEGRYSIEISLEDSSVVIDKESRQDGLLAGVPQFRSIRSTASVLLRDGQTTQFIAGTDKITGETLQVDVSVNVVK